MTFREYIRELLREVTDSKMSILFLLGAVCILGLSLEAQTKADASTQLKNLTISPIASVERWTCTDNPTAPVNCDGLSMIRLTLTDGTVVGPFVGITASQTIQSNGKWTSVPLAAPTPSVPPQKLSGAKK